MRNRLYWWLVSKSEVYPPWINRIVFWLRETLGNEKYE